jgi:oxygen-independent coproporphyrinogen-3 oxidase
MRIAPEVLRRLEIAAPRYTSYPTVPAWSDAFGHDDHARALDRAAAVDEPLSLYVHIPFCKDERQLEQLWSDITARFTLAPDAEVAIEIDPVVTSQEQLALLGRFGFNRLSMGVQDFDPDVQRAVNRVQSIDETAVAIAGARAAGFVSVNLDLIYGLPHQTVASFARTMDAVVSLAPDRVACFSFAYVPAARPNQRRLPLAAIPTGADKLALLEVAQERLAAAGYRAIGMDHFALAADELARAQEARTLWRDFQGYTTQRARTTIAVGASAISDFGEAYAQNEHALGQYEAAIAAGRHATVKGCWLDDDDRRRRAVIVQLMCNGWVDLGPDGERHFARELERLAGAERDGLVAARGREILLTELGRTFVRNVAMVFDAHLADGAARPVFSTTI